MKYTLVIPTATAATAIIEPVKPAMQRIANVLPNWLTREVVLAVAFTWLLVQMAVPFPVVVVVTPVFGLLGLLFLPLRQEEAGAERTVHAGFLLVIASIFFYGIGIVHSGGVLYRHNVRDLPGIAIALMLLLLTGSVSLDSARNIYSKLSKYACIVATALCIVSIYKFAMLLNGQELSWLVQFGENESHGTYPGGTSLNSDYNFYALFILIGLLSAAHLALGARTSNRLRAFAILALPLLAVCVVLAGSRRAWTVFGLVAAYGIARLGIQLVLRRGLPKGTLTALACLCGMTVLTGAALIVNGRDVLDVLNSTVVEALSSRFETLTGSDGTLVDSFSSRTDAWQYGINQIVPRYSPFQLLVGDGFGYLREYARAFPFWQEEEDYPHNLVLSALHYSGLLGAGVVAALLALPILRTIYLRTALTDFVWLVHIILILFCLPSSNSIFNIYGHVALLVFTVQIAIPKVSPTSSSPTPTTSPWKPTDTPTPAST